MDSKTFSPLISRTPPRHRKGRDGENGHGFSYVTTNDDATGDANEDKSARHNTSMPDGPPCGIHRPGKARTRRSNTRGNRNHSPAHIHRRSWPNRRSLLLRAIRRPEQDQSQTRHDESRRDQNAPPPGRAPPANSNQPWQRWPELKLLFSSADLLSKRCRPTYSALMSIGGKELPRIPARSPF